jgi:MFS family permease
MSDLDSATPGIAQVLRHRSFRLLFGGISLSRTGDAMTFVVLSWLALNIGGPGAVGLVVFVNGCLAPISAPFLGYLMDRLGMRLLMVTDNLIRGLLILVLAALVHTGQAGLPHLVGFAVLVGLLSPATELGQDVAVPTLLTSRELDAANRLMAASWDISAWIGPAVAGFGIELFGYTPVLVVDAATFFVMAAVSLTMPGRSETTGESAESAQHGALRRLFSGFVILWKLRPVVVMTLLSVANLFLGGMMEVFLPAFNQINLDGGAGEYGLLVSIAGVMSLLGTLVLTPLVTRLGYGPGLILVLIARGLAVLPLAFVGSWTLAAVFLAIASLPDGSFFPMARTVQQRLVPPEVRGRVQGARGALGVMGWPLGGAVGGLLVAGWGPSAVAIVIGLAYLPLAYVIFRNPLIMRHTAPAPDETDHCPAGPTHAEAPYERID